MSAKLIAEEGLLEGLVLSLEKGNEWVIGRDPADCQLVVSDPEASRRHLRVLHLEDGNFQVENLSETNPVQINDEPLTEPRVLQHGDAVKLGGSRFRFYVDLGGASDSEEEDDDEEKEQEEDKQEQVMDNQTLETDKKETVEVHEDELFFPQSGELARVDFGLEDTGRFMLKVIRGPNNGAEFSMEPGRTYVFGTAPNSCDVVFHDISVSRQHAKLTVETDHRLFIEDMGSRNGTLIDEVKINGRTPLAQNAVVSLGTTSFIVFDREGERQTIITPLLPSIVKTLQKEEGKKSEKKTVKAPRVGQETLVKPLPPPPAPKKNYLFRGLLLSGLIGLLALFGMGTSTLFRSQAVVPPEVNAITEINKVMADYPSLQYTFSRDKGRLLLVGHVLTPINRSQLLYQLQLVPMVKSVDDSNLIIDEYVWKETNQILNKNPQWTGVSLHSPSPGRFIISGYLKTRKQADQLNDFLAQNFRYLDRLDNRVIVEEDETNAINVLVGEKGFRDVTMEMHNGEVTLSGTIGADRLKDLDALIQEIKKRPTVRLVKDYVSQIEPEQSLVDVTNNYRVSGSSSRGGSNISVVINGRILTKGDLLDGMVIKEIKRNTILLERDGVKYKIEYNK